MTFKIGDRVIAYARFCTVKGKVVEVNDNLIGIQYEENGDLRILFFHPKQCRKLKPKKRREWWINLQEIDTGSFKMAAGEHFLKSWFNNPYGEFIRTTPPPNKEGWIKVREVKE